jgi:hypothetical protein
MKKLLTTTPVLLHPDIAKPFDIYCDASGTGLGCVFNATKVSDFSLLVTVEMPRRALSYS